MLSKNNNRELQRKIDDRQDRFTLRKLSIGVASVLLGSFIMGTQSSQTAYASTTPQASEEVTADSNGNSTTPQASEEANGSGDSQAPNTQQASIKDALDYPNTNKIVPEGQYIFDQFRLTDDKLTNNNTSYTPLNKVITLATNRDDPGGILNYYTRIASL